MQRLPRELNPLRQPLARGLVERGILSEQHSKRLGVLPTTRFPTVDPAPERDLRERLREVLLAGRDPTEEEALLLGLLEPLGLIDSLVATEERRAARKRAKTIATQGLAGTAVRDATRGASRRARRRRRGYIRHHRGLALNPPTEGVARKPGAAAAAEQPRQRRGNTPDGTEPRAGATPARTTQVEP